MSYPKRARAHRKDPSTSHAAARKATKNAGGLKVTQQSIMVVMRMLGRPVLDEELEAEYARQRKALMLPDQTPQSIRSRRAELSKLGKLVEHEKRKMSTGGWGRTWAVPDP